MDPELVALLQRLAQVRPISTFAGPNRAPPRPGPIPGVLVRPDLTRTGGQPGRGSVTARADAVIEPVLARIFSGPTGGLLPREDLPAGPSIGPQEGIRQFIPGPVRRMIETAGQSPVGRLASAVSEFVNPADLERGVAGAGFRFIGRTMEDVLTEAGRLADEGAPGEAARLLNAFIEQAERAPSPAREAADALAESRRARAVPGPEPAAADAPVNLQEELDRILRAAELPEGAPQVLGGTPEELAAREAAQAEAGAREIGEATSRAMGRGSEPIQNLPENQERAAQEALDWWRARKAAGERGVPLSRETANKYIQTTSLPEPVHNPVQNVREDLHRRVADAYEAAESQTRDLGVRRAYKALVAETEAQFKAIQEAGIKIVPTKDDPYPNSAAMVRDVQENKRLRVFSGETEHPLLTHDQQVKFRAVHDYFGHSQNGNQFGPMGEENAFRDHWQMFSEEARKAMATETRGQNSWVNFGPKSNLPVRERPFAEQKAFILPQELRVPYEQADPLVEAADEAARVRRIQQDMAETFQRNLDEVFEKNIPEDDIGRRRFLNNVQKITDALGGTPEGGSVPFPFLRSIATGAVGAAGGAAVAPEGERTGFATAGGLLGVALGNPSGLARAARELGEAGALRLQPGEPALRVTSALFRRGNPLSRTKFKSIANDLDLPDSPELYNRSLVLWRDVTRNVIDRDAFSINALDRLTREGFAGAHWYDNARSEAQALLGERDGDMFLRFVAATSPLTPFTLEASGSDQITRALSAFREWKMGVPFGSTASYGVAHPAVVGNLRRISKGKDPRGQKTLPFMRALLGDEDAVVVDRWMMRAFGLSKDTPNKTELRFIEQMVRDDASRHGLTPRQYQAAIWEGVRVGDADIGEDLLSMSAEELATVRGGPGPVLRRRIENAGGLANFLISEGKLDPTQVPF